MFRAKQCLLRPYSLSDLEALQQKANDPVVSRWMTGLFPYPYTLDDARFWVNRASAESPADNLVIEVDGNFAGAVGIEPHAAHLSGVAGFGYWLNPYFWGRGIATEASALMVQYAFGERGLRRLEAHVFAPNIASARVLEKCGFRLEATQREGVIDRDGRVLDRLLYSHLASERGK